MSYINDVVMQNINDLNIKKTGYWDKPEPPPPNTFDIHDIYILGRCIITEIESNFADKFIYGL